MGNGGVSYAKRAVLNSEEAQDVPELNHCKFISGSNPASISCILNECFPSITRRVRGERTLCEHMPRRKEEVLRVPCYTFHDGFATYSHLLHGALPLRLKFVSTDSEDVVARFYRACVGWIRYKPLLLYISRREEYAEVIRGIQREIRPRHCPNCARILANPAS